MHQRRACASSSCPVIEAEPTTKLAGNTAIISPLKFCQSRRVQVLAHSWSGVTAVGLLLAVLHVPAQAAISVEAAEGTAVTPTVLSDLKSEAERESEAIASALGVDPGGTVQIIIAREFYGHEVEMSRSYPEASLIIIPPHVLARRIVPLAHELTHIIAGRGADDLFSEGLAVYNQERFGSDPAFPNFGQPIEIALRDAIMRRYGAKTWPEAVRKFELELGPAPDRPIMLSRWIEDTDDTDTRTLAYLTAASYVGYLIDSVFKGDMRAFFPLYRSGNYAQDKLSAEDAWSGWLRALQNG
jgi:hypothetical protein